MSKHLDSLEILCNKMRVKYGDADDLVLQLKQELSALKEKRVKNFARKSFGRRIDDKLVQEHSIH